MPIVSNFPGGSTKLYGGISAEQISFSGTTTGMDSQNVQDAIVELFTDVSNGKSLVAGAITDKGISTSANATFQQMATNIGQIETNNLPSWFSECDIYEAVSSYNEYRPFFVLVSEKYIIPVIQIVTSSGSDISYDINGLNYDERYSIGVFLLNSGTLIRLIITTNDDYDEMSIDCTDGNFEFGSSLFSENNLKFFVCKN